MFKFRMRLSSEGFEKQLSQIIRVCIMYTHRYIYIYLYYLYIYIYVCVFVCVYVVYGVYLYVYVYIYNYMNYICIVFPHWHQGLCFWSAVAVIPSRALLQSQYRAKATELELVLVTFAIVHCMLEHLYTSLIIINCTSTCCPRHRVLVFPVMLIEFCFHGLGGDVHARTLSRWAGVLLCL